MTKNTFFSLVIATAMTLTIGCKQEANTPAPESGSQIETAPAETYGPQEYRESTTESSSIEDSSLDDSGLSDANESTSE